jgi:hypothetical protein
MINHQDGFFIWENYSVLLSVRMTDRIERKKKKKKTRFANHNSYFPPVFIQA